ncbi:MAG: hypothetical protein R6V56_08295 [Lentisphaeria bacterium]
MWSNKRHLFQKSLVLTRKEGWQLLDMANKKKLLVGGAPDTFMGGWHPDLPGAD